MSNYNFHCAFTNKKYDISKLKLNKPKQMPGARPWYLAEAKWEGKEFHFTTPKTRCGGTKTKFIEGTETIKEFYIRQEMCARENVGHETVQETNFKQYLLDIEDLIWEKLQEWYKDKDLMKTLPTNVKSQIREAIEEKDKYIAIKPILFPGTKVDPETKDSPKKKFIVDSSKPENAIFKIWTNRKLQLFATINGKKNSDLMYKYQDNPGMVMTRISFDGVYLGGHGDKTWCASARFRVHEMKYKKLPEMSAPLLLGYDSDEPSEDEYPTQNNEESEVSEVDGPEEEFKPIKVTPEETNAESDVEPESSEEEEKPKKKAKRSKKKRRNRDE